MPSKRHGIYRAGLLAAVIGAMLFYAPGSLGAAPPTFSDREELNWRARQEDQERQMRARERDVFLQEQQPAAPETELPAEAVSFSIHTLRLTGEHADKFPWARELLAQYKDKRIGLEGINVIVKRLTGEFVRRGYITTRIIVPEQDLSAGTLELVLIPGIIHDIRFAAPDSQGNWRNALPARPGDILNLRDLEQGLEQMKRVPSQDADIRIIPGENPGESDILITLKRSKPWKIVLSADNSGFDATGERQGSLAFALDNPFGRNDLGNISLNQDLESKSSIRGTRGDSIHYSLPYGYWTFDLDASRYKYHQTIAGSDKYAGENESWELAARRIFHRDQTGKTGFGLKLLKNYSHSFINDAEIGVQRRNATALELSLFQRRYMGHSILDVELAHRIGVPWCGAQGEGDGLPEGVPTTRYHLWLLDANFTKPLKIGQTPAWYTAHLRAQSCGDLLYAIDQFSIGNRYTVRGFDGEQTLSAEKGIYLRNELGLSIGKGQEAYLALDCGRVGGPSAQWLPGKTLIGTALGLRGSSHGLQYDIFIGWPLQKPEGLKTAPSTLGFQLTCAI